MSLGEYPDDSLRSLDGVDTRGLTGGWNFDLMVIGSGPAGQKAATTAARAGARVALVERDPMAGGVCLNTGTIPSKSLREAVMYLTGYRQRGYYGEKYRLKDKVSTGDLLARTNHVIRMERETVNEELVAQSVTRIVGFGRVSGRHEVSVRVGDQEYVYTTHRLIVSTGTQPRRPPEVPFDEVNIFDSDSVFGTNNQLRPLPDSMIVLGAGVIGIEYASMFGALGIPTFLVDARPSPLSFVDDEIAHILYDTLERNGVSLRFGQEFGNVYTKGEPRKLLTRALIDLATGETLEADALLFSLGRTPMTGGIGLESQGVELDRRGNIVVNEQYQTGAEWIYAAGDVIGFPALASTSSEQGRIAALHALGIPVTWHPDTIPYGIYTIPEVSMVGATEQQLKKDGTPYYCGTSLWRDTARGKIIGDLSGALKLLFSSETNHLIGVHIIGEGATELLHIGQAVMHFGGGPEYFTSTVFNYPTLAEAYKIAAHNAQNRLQGTAIRTTPLREQLKQRGFSTDEFIPWKGIDYTDS